MMLIIMLTVATAIAIFGIILRVRARTVLAIQNQELAAPTVLTAPPIPGEPASEIALPGNVQAFVDSPVYARTSGYLHKWYFDIGARVRKGQLLAEIESPEVDRQLLQARADLATAEANASNAQTTAVRYQGLLHSNAVSQQDTENASTLAAATATAVKSAQANVQRLEQLVNFEKIYAPFDGVITARNVDIAAAQTLRVFVNVPQIYSRNAIPGIMADLTFNEFPGRRFQGRMVRTSNQIDPVSRTLLAEIDVDNRSGELLPGAFTQVHLKLDTQSQHASYIIPVTALIFRSEGLRVATVVRSNIAKLVPIVIGRDDGSVVQVVTGLDPNSQVIQNPPDSIIDGEKVEVVSHATAGGGK
jgi:RND family efflux transporter MFP subunit